MSAYDQDPASTSKAVANFVFTYAEQVVHDFTIDSDPGNRTSVILRVRMQQAGWSNPNDSGYLLFKPYAAWTPWIKLGVYRVGDIPTSPTWFEFDIASYVGALPLSSVLVAWQFVKGTTFEPPEPNDP